MSALYNDIIKQPTQWQHCLDYTMANSQQLVNACSQLMAAQRIIIVAIGASYNAGLAIKHMLDPWHLNVCLVDASEYMNDGKFYSGDVALFLTRSGKSIELIKIMDKCKTQKVSTISICNDAESPIGIGSDVFLNMNVAFDHAVSINTFTSIILVGMLIRDHIKAGKIDYDEYTNGFERVEEYILNMDVTIQSSDWCNPANYYYFLGRGIDYSAACEAMLLWQEAAKLPAIAMTTGSFRHGPQEVVSTALSAMVWVDYSNPNYEYDLILIEDLKKNGANVLVFGDKDDVVDITPLKAIRPLVNQILPQLLSLQLAKIRNVNPDGFVFCNYIVEKEGGL
jgi:glutamine---fructose-6-phosphate transaminase (isomerizing)